MKKNTKKNDLSIIVFILFFIILSIYALSVIYSYVWALLTSFKTYDDFMTNVAGFPAKITFQNYVDVFKNLKVPVVQNNVNGKAGFIAMLIYSVVYAVGSAALSTIVPCITAYAVAHFDFKFGKFVYAIVVVTMILPIIGSTPSMIQVTKFFGMYDNVIGVCFLKANFLGMYFLIFYSTFKTFSKDYAEAALVDGANEFVIMFRIILPLVTNIISIVFVLMFIQFWNDYQTPLLFMPNYPTISYGLLSFSDAGTTLGGNMFANVQMTACILLLLPVIVIFLVFKDKMMGNLTLGGIKG